MGLLTSYSYPETALRRGKDPKTRYVTVHLFLEKVCARSKASKELRVRGFGSTHPERQLYIPHANRIYNVHLTFNASLFLVLMCQTPSKQR